MTNEKDQRRQRSQKGQRVLRCPKCKSAGMSLWMGARLGMQYFCKKCGYRGPLVIEEDIER